MEKENKLFEKNSSLHDLDAAEVSKSSEGILKVIDRLKECNDFNVHLQNDELVLDIKKGDKICPNLNVAFKNRESKNGVIFCDRCKFQTGFEVDDYFNISVEDESSEIELCDIEDIELRETIKYLKGLE